MPKPLRTRSRWRVVVIALVVLLILLVIGDRVALAVAESKAASLLEQSENLDGKPDVDISGFPFLTQVITGDYARIDVTADKLTLVDDSVRIPIRDMHVTLHDVTVPHDFSGADVATATGTARLDLTDLSSLLHLQVRYLGGDQLGTEQSVAGQTISLQFGVEKRGDGIGFTDAKATLNGQQFVLPATVADPLNAALGTVVSTAGLPFRVHLNAVNVGPKGISLALSGTDIRYRR